MADSVDEDFLLLIVYGIDGPPIPLSDAIAFLPGELLGAVRPRGSS